MSVSHKAINNVLLIKCIESRPALYNKKLAEYNNIPIKAALWEEIANILFPSSMKNMTANQKEKAVQHIQNRWKNLRACYRREIRQQMKSDNPRRRKYIYFKRLAFLEPHVDHDTEQNSSQAEDVTGETEGKEEYLDMEEDDDESTEDVSENKKFFEHSSLKRRRDSIHNFEEVEISNRDIDGLNNTSINMDADMNFALSLVPWFRSMPLRNKLNAQIAVLQVLQQYVSGNED